MMVRKLKVFTWHIHGSYLYYLSQGDYELYIPVNENKTEGYYGRGETFPFGDNVIEIPAREVKLHQFDCILFQTVKNFFVDQFEILSEAQRSLPKIFLEHDSPRDSPADSLHPVQDPDVLMVHVTHYNQLMWHNKNRIVEVIDHGVTLPDFSYTGELDRGIVVINHMHQRGRKLGADIYEKVSRHVPLDLVGMGTKEYGGLGEVLHPDLPEFISRYRFFFNPIRYTSFGLAVCEAMMMGIPVVALATTEYVTVIQNNVSGFIHTDVDYLIDKMRLLIRNKSLALQLGEEGQREALRRFNINRFTHQWKSVFQKALSATMNKEISEKVYEGINVFNI
jgi:hypothetical protein